MNINPDANAFPSIPQSIKIESQENLDSLQQNIPETTKARFINRDFSKLTNKATLLSTAGRAFFAGSGMTLGIALASMVTTATVALTPAGWILAGAAVGLAVIGLSILLYRHHELKSQGLNTDLKAELIVAFGTFCTTLAISSLISLGTALIFLLEGASTALTAVSHIGMVSSSIFALTMAGSEEFERKHSYPLIESQDDAKFVFKEEYAVIDTDAKGKPHLLIRTQEATEKLVQLAQQAQDLDNPKRNEALCQLADMHLNGNEENNVLENATRARELYQIAALNGDPWAQFSLAQIYDKGQGIQQDSNLANQLFLQAAAAGHVGAQITLARRYEKGQGIEQNEQEAITWYKKAALAGKSKEFFKEQGEAQCLMANRYAQGEGVEQDESQASEYFLRAAQDGHLVAQVEIAKRYENGIGLKQDVSEAIKWYTTAAQTEKYKRPAADNYLKAAKLAELLKDQKLATNLYEKAAWQDDTVAQAEMAKRFENNTGLAHEYSPLEREEIAKKWKEVLSGKRSVRDVY